MQGCSFDGIRFRRCGNCFLEIFLSRRRERGALCSPTFPRATGCERVSTFSRSPGAALAGSLVSDDARSCSFDGVRFRQSGNGSLEIFLSDDAGRGALRSPTPPRVTGCERVSTLSRSPGAGLVGNSVSVDTSYSGDLFTAARDSLGLWRSSFRSIRRMYPYISFDTGWVERKYGRGFGLGGDGSAGGRTSFSGGFFSDGTSHLPLVAG